MAPPEHDNIHGIHGIAQIAGILVTQESLEALLRRFAETAVSVVHRCDAASVSMSEDGRISTWAATEADAERVDQHQYQCDEGPCLDATRTGQASFVDSFKSDDRWPALAPLAVAEGMASMCSLPLKVEGVAVGALNLYSRSRSFAFHDLQAAEALSDQAGVAVTNVQAYQRAMQRVRDLEAALGAGPPAVSDQSGSGDG